jgi:uncharacterized membrane protein YedE/YeeE
MTIDILGLTIGLMWGVLFYKSGVFIPKTILDQFLFKDFTMMKMMLSAIFSSIVFLWALSFFLEIALPVKPFDLYPNIFGGLFMGIGISLTGACPGTVWAQLGAGHKNAWFVVLGGVLTATLYGLYLPEIEKFFGSGVC